MGASRRRLRVTAVTHLSLTVGLIVWNYVANAGGVFGKSVGQVSRELDNVFTPASYAFAIWGPIYLGLLGLGAYEVRLAFRPTPPSGEVCENERFILQLGHWFSIAQLACGLWLVAWLSEAVLVSLLLMGTLLFSLGVCVHRTNMERWHAPSAVIAFVWWPLSLYSGWISVAFLANLSALLAAHRVAAVQQEWWALALGALIVTVHCRLVWKRNMREFSMVGAWALVAVAIRHAGDPALFSVHLGALFGALVLVSNALVHAWLNFEVPPDLAKRFPITGRFGARRRGCAASQ